MNTQNTGNAPSSESTTQMNGNVFELHHKKQQKFLLCAENNYKSDERITVSSFTFINRVIKLLEPYFCDANEEDNFDWSNMFVSGGLISGVMEIKFHHSCFANSDIDIFIYGLSKKKIGEKMDYIRNYLVNKFKNQIYIFIYQSAMVMTILIPGHNPLQIIGFSSSVKNPSTPMTVLESFDLTHCQIGIDMHSFKIFHTNDFINAIQNKTTTINKKQPSIQLYRLVKAYLRGYSIIKPEQLYIKNFYHVYIQDFIDADEYLEKVENGTYIYHGVGKSSCLPTNTNKRWSIDDLNHRIDEIMNDPIVIKNLNKIYHPTTDEDPHAAIEKIRSIYGKDKEAIIMLNWPGGPLDSQFPNTLRFLFPPDSTDYACTTLNTNIRIPQ